MDSNSRFIYRVMTEIFRKFIFSRSKGLGMTGSFNLQALPCRLVFVDIINIMLVKFIWCLQKGKMQKERRKKE